MRALDGVKVLDISRLLPGPFCSMVLADHGAEVISIEDKRFEKDDLFFTEVYRNKKHITLNLKSAEGKEIFFQLAEASDVIINSHKKTEIHMATCLTKIQITKWLLLAAIVAFQPFSLMANDKTPEPFRRV